MQLGVHSAQSKSLQGSGLKDLIHVWGISLRQQVWARDLLLSNDISSLILIRISLNMSPEHNLFTRTIQAGKTSDMRTMISSDQAHSEIPQETFTSRTENEDVNQENNM